MRRIVTTADGSTSIEITDANVQYHSKHGAILEAKHVFIQSGLAYLISQNIQPISIFEMGFGTGLNALLTYLFAKKHQTKISYTTIDLFPVELKEIKSLNFAEQLNIDPRIFLQFHESEWGQKHSFLPNFNFQKIGASLQEYSSSEQFDLIYFDAFGATAQPELWTISITDKLFQMMKNNAVLVTYSAKGSFRRNLLASGFSVEKIPGPPGKREMLRAIKNPC